MAKEKKTAFWAVIVIMVMFLSLQSAAAVPKIPAQLFDIKLELEEKVLHDSRSLNAFVTLESFGSEPTPVDLAYVVLDGSGNEVYSKNSSVTVRTAEFVSERFDQLDLGPGSYILVLRTFYNSGVVDEFRQGFEVIQPQPESPGWWVFALFAAALAFALYLSAKHVLKARQLPKKRK